MRVASERATHFRNSWWNRSSPWSSGLGREDSVGRCPFSPLFIHRSAGYVYFIDRKLGILASLCFSSGSDHTDKLTNCGVNTRLFKRLHSQKRRHHSVINIDFHLQRGMTCFVSHPIFLSTLKKRTNPFRKQYDKFYSMHCPKIVRILAP